MFGWFWSERSACAISAKLSGPLLTWSVFFVTLLFYQKDFTQRSEFLHANLYWPNKMNNMRYGKRGPPLAYAISNLVFIFRLSTLYLFANENENRSADTFPCLEEKLRTCYVQNPWNQLNWLQLKGIVVGWNSAQSFFMYECIRMYESWMLLRPRHKILYYLTIRG